MEEGWGWGGKHHKACDWVLQPRLGERSTSHRGKEAEPQATGETETGFMKQSEARTSAHPFDKAFFFFLLPQSVLRRRCCVAKLLSRGAGGGVTLHGLLLREGELGPGARGLLEAGVGVHGLVGGWLLVGVLRQEGDGRVDRSRLGLREGFHVGDALIAHVLSRVQHPLWTPPRVLRGRWGTRR